jgi:hypothetical protein
MEMNEVLETGTNIDGFSVFASPRRDECQENGTKSDERFLAKAVWQELEEKHHTRVSAWVTPVLERRSRHERHPVYDFLFEYYSFRPAQLLRWSPGPGVILEDAEIDDGAGVWENFGSGSRLRLFPGGRRPFVDSTPVRGSFAQL